MPIYVHNETHNNTFIGQKMIEDQLKLTKEELVSIWDQSEDNYGLIKTAYELGYNRGKLAQAREDNVELNAVLSILENHDDATISS